MGALTALVALVFVSLWSWPARGETFVFQDPEQPPLTGRVLIEFPDLLFVVLDGQPPSFLRRAEIVAIVDEEGRRHEPPSLGQFGPVGKATPVLAVTDVSGSAWRQGSGAEREVIPEQHDGAVFLGAGGVVSTGDNGTLRAVYPSGAQVWLGVESSLTIPSATLEVIALQRGEVTLETRLRPLRIALARPLQAQLSEGSQTLVRQVDGTTVFEQQTGNLQLAWPDLSLSVPHGHGLEVTELGLGSWKVKAHETNPDPVDLVAAGKLDRLQPGEERVIGVEVPAQGDEVWRVLTSRGELVLRRGPEAKFVPVTGPNKDEVVIGRGDALRTSAGGEVLLGRIDGARLSLGRASHLELLDDLELISGTMTLTALDAPVKLGTPGGRADLAQLVATFSRNGSGLGDPLEVASAAGRVVLPLGAIASLDLPEGGRSVVGRVALSASPAKDGPPEDGPAPDAPEERVAPLDVRQVKGKAQIRSQALPDLGDAGFVALLAAGDYVRVHGASERQRHGALGLNGERLLRYVDAGTNSHVLVSSSQLRFAERTPIALAKGLTLDVGRGRGMPMLRFKSGETLFLRDDAHLKVYNPTIEALSTGAKAKLEGGVEAVVQRGGRFSSLAFGTRTGDHLELASQGTSSLSKSQDQVRFGWPDGRSLWIEPRAPQVDARLGDVAGTLFLSMPGTPSLGLSPDRALTVLATNEGEFVILDKSSLGKSQIELMGLAGTGLGSTLLDPDRLRNLLDVPPPDSPSGP